MNLARLNRSENEKQISKEATKNTKFRVKHVRILRDLHTTMLKIFSQLAQTSFRRKPESRFGGGGGAGDRFGITFYQRELGSDGYRLEFILSASKGRYDGK
jgi:translation initiation factor 2 beta subunit (eIF-2beta)/eIF-5